MATATAKATPSTLPALGWRLLRLALLPLALWMLWRLWRSTGADLHSALLQGRRPLLLTALALYGIIQFIGALRWRTLLLAQGFPMSPLEAFRLTLTGNFFSLLIPGAVTGDVMKVAAANRHHPGHLAELAAIDLMDRMAGLSGIFIAAALATAVSWRQLLSLGESGMLLPVVALINCGCLATLIMWAAFQSANYWWRLPVVRRLFHFFWRHIPRFCRKIGARVLRSMALFRQHKGAVLRALGDSVVIHLMLSVMTFLIARGLQETALSLGNYILTTQLSNVTGLLPITPGGLGLRDAVTSQLLQAFGVESLPVTGTIPLLNSAIILFWGVVGAVAYSLTPGRR